MYPTKKQLRFIKKFDLLKRPVCELLDFIEQIWEYGDWGFIRKEHTLELHTGGWSGNEDIIAALKQNFLLWSMYWARHHRGGHFYFDDEMVAAELKGFITRYNEPQCFKCKHESITNIGSLHCAARKETLLMNPKTLLPAKSNGKIRAFRVRSMIDKCNLFEVKA